MTSFYHISAILPSLRHPDASCKSSRRFARVVPMTRPCCPEALTEATSLLNFPILRIGYLYDKGFYDINKQFSEGQLSVFLLLSHVFACCAVLLVVGKSGNKKMPPIKDEGNLMFSQRNNPYCELLRIDCKVNEFY